MGQNVPHFDELTGVQAAAVSHPVDYVTGTGWQKQIITYRIANCPKSLDCTTAKNAVRSAAKAWDSISGIQLQEVTTDGDIVISWSTDNRGDGKPFDGKGGTVALTAYPSSDVTSAIAGDIHFDDGETWVVGTTVAQFPQEVHLPTVALHELGHALGLRHSDDLNSLMWPVYSGIRVIGPDDIAGIQALYGPEPATK
jgi:predicted Zn-dependent protease